ncbi:MAG: InlB B-repeat-containing protein [Nitrososphaeraceae archaeon]
MLSNNITFAQNSLDDEDKNVHELFSSKSKPIIIAGSFPVGIDFNSISDKIYVANQFSNTLSIIDPDKAQVITNIEVEDSPYDVDANPFTNRIYVTNRVSNTISVIDGFTNKQLATVSVGDNPLNLAVNLANNLIYVSNINSGNINVIDALQNKIIETLNYTTIPYDIAVNPRTNLIYISDLGDNSIKVVNGSDNTLFSSIPVGSRPSVISLNMLSNMVYVSNYLSDSISVINGTTNEVIKNIQVGENPIGLTVNPITNKIYVSNSEDNDVSVINGTTNEVIKNISLESATITDGIDDPNIIVPSLITFPFIADKMTIDPSSNFVYLTNTRSNGILAIDGNTDELSTRLFIDTVPNNAGEVKCNDNLVRSGGFIIIPVDESVECKAIADRGYSFSSWSIKNNTNQNPLIFNVTGYGILTANFKGTLFTETFIILTSVAVGLASTIGGWLYRQRSKRLIKKYLSEIDYVYEVLSNKDKKECIKQLEQLQKVINQIHRNGKINESQLDFLEKKINWYVNRINQQLN